MLTAHLPSGYVLARMVRWPVPMVMPAALIGAVLPDIDMLWFLFVDQGQFHHHRYWVHVPLFWLVIAVVTLPVLARFGYHSTAVVFFVAIFLHLILDAISGGILWGAPLSDRLYSLVTVPPAYGHWVISFMLHWTFALELMIWGLAALYWTRRKRA